MTATIPTGKTGIIILDFLAGPELWCRPLGHRPKVQVRAFRLVLAAGPRFCAQNTSLYKGLRAQRRRRADRLQR
jgi:hypothetical protein